MLLRWIIALLVLQNGAWMALDGSRALLVLTPLGLWYLPFGTILNLAALIPLLLPAWRR